MFTRLFPSSDMALHNSSGNHYWLFQALKVDQLLHNKYLTEVSVWVWVFFFVLCGILLLLFLLKARLNAFVLFINWLHLEIFKFHDALLDKEVSYRKIYIRDIQINTKPFREPQFC